MTKLLAMVQANWRSVMQGIASAAMAAGRTADSVKLLAVSKTHSAECVRAAVQAGQRMFGENYVQEAITKMGQLADLKLLGIKLEWHFIGPLQSNKTAEIAQYFDWAHSVDRMKIAQRLSAARSGHQKPLNICLQVNISGEANKQGVAAQDIPALAEAVASLPNLQLRGLMAIPEPTDDSLLLHKRFAAVKELFHQLNASGFKLDTLSMGMSNDLAIAIEEGASMVRIGTAIFGGREKKR